MFSQHLINKCISSSLTTSYGRKTRFMSEKRIRDYRCYLFSNVRTSNGTRCNQCSAYKAFKYFLSFRIIKSLQYRMLSQGLNKLSDSLWIINLPGLTSTLGQNSKKESRQTQVDIKVIHLDSANARKFDPDYTLRQLDFHDITSLFTTW